MASSTASSQTDTTAATYGLLPIGVATLSASESLDFSLYMYDKENQEPRLYRDKAYPLLPKDLQQLKNRGVRTLYLQAADAVLYKRHVRENLDQFLKDESVPLTRRYEMLQDAARQMLADSFQQGETYQIVEEAAEISNRIMSLVCDQQVVVSELLEVMYHDFNTCGHSFNVSAYCVMIAKGLGIEGQKEVEQIAIGALLHDVGKLQVPPGILNKTGRLTPHERETVRRHPQAGFRELCFQEALSWGQLMMVYQHHERIDGDGYPVGIPATEIHPWARLCSVADVFDAMTCHRPDRKRFVLSDVVKHINEKAGKRLDKEIVQCWTAMVKAKPSRN